MSCASPYELPTFAAASAAASFSRPCVRQAPNRPVGFARIRGTHNLRRGFRWQDRQTVENPHGIKRQNGRIIMQADIPSVFISSLSALSTIRLFLVEKIHRAFQPDRRERKDRVAEHLEPLGRRAPCPTTPQHIVDLVAPGEIPPTPSASGRSPPFPAVRRYSSTRYAPGTAPTHTQRAERQRDVVRYDQPDFPGRSSRPPSSNGRLCPKGSWVEGFSRISVRPLCFSSATSP